MGDEEEQTSLNRTARNRRQSTLLLQSTEGPEEDTVEDMVDFAKWVRNNGTLSRRSASASSAFVRSSSNSERMPRMASLQKQRPRPLQPPRHHHYQRPPQMQQPRRRRTHHAYNGWDSRFATSGMPQYDASRDRHSRMYRRQSAKRQAPVQTQQKNSASRGKSSELDTTARSSAQESYADSTAAASTSTRVSKMQSVYHPRRAVQVDSRSNPPTIRNDEPSIVERLQETIAKLKLDSSLTLSQHEQKAKHEREQRDRIIQRLRSKASSLESRLRESENKLQERVLQIESLRMEIQRIDNRQIESRNELIASSRIERLRRKLQEYRAENRTFRDEIDILRKQQRTMEELDLGSLNTVDEKLASPDMVATNNGSFSRHNIQAELARVRRKLKSEKRKTERMGEQLTSQSLLMEKNGKLMGYLERDRNEKQQMIQEMNRLERELLDAKQTKSDEAGREQRWHSERKRLESEIAAMRNRAEEAERNSKSVEDKLVGAESRVRDMADALENVRRAEMQESVNLMEKDGHLQRALSRVSELERAKSILEEQNARLKEDLSQQEQYCITVKRQLLEREQQMAEQEKSMQNTRAELISIKTRGLMDVEHSKREANRLQTLVSQLEHRVSELSQQMKQLQSEGDTLSSERDQFKHEADHLRTQFETSEREKMDLQRLYDEAKQWHGRLQGAEQRYTQLSETNTRLMQRLQKMEQQP